MIHKVLIRQVIYLSTILIGALIGIIQFRRINLVFKLLTCFLAITFLSETTSYILATVVHNNSLINKIYAPIQIFFFGTIYYQLFILKVFKNLSLVLSGLLFLFVVFFISLRRVALFPSIPVTIISIVLILFSIFYFYQMLLNPFETKLLKSSYFWFNTAVLVCFAGAIPLFATFNYLFYKKIKFPLFGPLLDTLNIMHYSLLAFSLILQVKSNKE